MAPTTGLRAARKEIAAQRKPAKAPAKKAPAKKAAPAKKVAAKKTATPAGPKLRWTIVADHANGKEQTAQFGGGELAIVKAGDGWKAVYRVDGKVRETLAEGGFGRCYDAAVKHSKAGAA
jgi:hypothetical protein